MPIPEEIPYEITIRGDESKEVSVEELANFLRDLVFLHDRLWIIGSKEHREYPLDASFFYTRNGRPLPPEQRLRLGTIRRESPYELSLIIASAALGLPSAWAFFEIIRGVLLLPGERRIQALEIQKLQGEVKQSREVSTVSPVARAEQPSQRLGDILDQLTEDESLPDNRRETELRLLERDVERISQDAFRITEVEVKRRIVHKVENVKGDE